MCESGNSFQGIPPGAVLGIFTVHPSAEGGVSSPTLCLADSPSVSLVTVSGSIEASILHSP